MKLSKAKKIAKKNNQKWIAVDKDGEIFGFKNKPITEYADDFWYMSRGDYNDFFIGLYKGKKNWKKTLRKVK